MGLHEETRPHAIACKAAHAVRRGEPAEAFLHSTNCRPVPAFAGVTDNLAREFTAAWGCGEKMEGLFPYGPVACMQWEGKRSVFGEKPNLETQGFWPARPALANSTRHSTYGLSPAARMCG